jgi:2-alkyl-3-oxoalkanoate reductase
MRRALVTGATGGLGLALVPALLARGYWVRATGRDPCAGERLRAAGAEFVAADLTDPAQAASLVADCDVVFHAAALSSAWGAAASFTAINVEATGRLLDTARRTGCDAFVFISTPSVYAEFRDRLHLTEESALARRFANDYVATKFAAERLVLAANAPGFATVAVRPRALVGPDDRVLLPRLLRVAQSGWFPLFRGGRAMIELTDVADAAAAIVAADTHRSEIGGRVFNISGGAPMSVRDTLGIVFAAMGLAPRLIEAPFALAAGAMAMAEAFCARWPGQPEPPATVYSLSTLAFSQTFDLSAAHEALSWAPRVSPEDAIARTAAQWDRHAPL